MDLGRSSEVKSWGTSGVNLENWIRVTGDVVIKRFCFKFQCFLRTH